MTGPERHTAPAKRPRRWLRWVRNGLFGLVAGVLGFWLALQIPPVGRAVVNGAARIFNPFEGARIEVGAVAGNFVTRLRLANVRLVRVDGVAPAGVDTLAVRFRLLPLLRGELRLTAVSVHGPALTMTQTATGGWDLAGLLPDDRDTTATTSALRVRVDTLRLAGGRGRMDFFTPGRDSSLTLTRLDARLSGLVVGPEMRMRVDTLTAAFVPPGRADTVGVALGAALADSTLTVSGFRLRSARSDVAGSLRMGQGMALTVAATPLAFEDVRPFWPPLDPQGHLSLTASVTGQAEGLVVTARGRTSDGATLTAEGLVRPDSGNLVVRLTGTMRDLNPALFDRSAVPGRLGGRLRVDLAGPAPERLDGTATLTLDAARFGTIRLARTTLDASLTDGTARLDAAGVLNGAAFRVAGSARPFDAVPAYDLEAGVDHLDAGTLAPSGAMTTDLTGLLRVRGSGFAAPDRHAEVRLELAPSTWNLARLAGGTVTTLLRGDSLRAAADVAFAGGGRVAAKGTLVTGETPSFAVPSARFVDVPLAALAGDTTRSAVSGTVSLHGSGTDPAALAMEADLHLSETTYDRYALRQAEVKGSLRQGRLAVTAEARLRGGDVAFRLTGRPFDTRPSLVLEKGRFEGLDVGALMGVAGVRSRLDGTVAGRVTGFDPATMRLSLSTKLGPSLFNAQPLEGAALTVEGAGGDFRGGATVHLPGETVHLAAAWKPVADPPAFSLTSDDLAGLDLGALLGRPDLTTRLYGTLSVTGSGAEDALALDARLALHASAVNAAQVPEALATFSLREGRARFEAGATFGQGALRLRADGRPFEDAPTFNAELIGERLPLDRLAGADSVGAAASFRMALTGAGTDPASMRLDAHLRVDSLRYGAVQVEESGVALHLEDGFLTVDSVLVRGTPGRLGGRGTLALFDTLRASDLRFEAVPGDLAPLAPLLGLSALRLNGGHLSGRLTGPPDRLALSASVSLEGLVYDDVHVVSASAGLEGVLDRRRRLAEATLRDAEMAFVSVPSFTLQRIAFEGTYRPGEVTFGTDFRVDRRRRGGLRGRMDLDPAHRLITLDSLALRLDEDRWELLQEATLTYGDHFEVRNLLLFAGEQQIAVDGEINLSGEQSLTLSLEGFRLDAVADLIGYDGLGGQLDGWMLMSGPAEAPVLEGSLNAALTSSGVPAGELRTDLHYADRRLALEAEVFDEAGRPFTATGTLPLDFRLVAPADSVEGVRVQARQAAPESGVDLHLRAEDFSVGWLLPLLARTLVDDLGGRATGEVRIAGTLEAPSLSGAARLREGRIGLPLLGRKAGLVYHDGTLDLTFEGRQVRVEHLTLHSGHGTVSGTGTIDLAELTLGAFHIDLEATDFLAVDSREYRVEAGGTLSLRGTTRAPVLSGRVQAVAADVFLTEETTAEELEPVQLSPRDEQILARRFGVRLTEADTTTFDFYEALTIEDLTVTLERDTWLRSSAIPKMDIQFTGDLDVSKAPHADPAVFGVINVLPDRSRIEMFGRRFRLERGTLTFNGPATDPVMDIKAVYEVRARGSGGNEVTITLEVNGVLEDLEVTPGSDPPMEVSDIISYLAFGQPASEAFQLGGGTQSGGPTLLNPATGFAVGQLTGFLENLAGTSLGLDVIDIEQDGLKGATVTAGKYLSPRLYVAVSQPISFQKTTLGTGEENEPVYVVEYELINRLLIRLLRDGHVIRVNMKWEYAY